MRYLTILKRNIHTIPLSEFIEYYPFAKILSPDPKDSLYFALAMKMKIPIWSNDNRLKNQKEIMIYNTSDILKLFFSHDSKYNPLHQILRVS